MKVIGKSDPKKTGTKVSFMPDSQIFKNRVFKFETLAERLRELAFLNPDVKLRILDLRKDQEHDETFHFKGGIAEFVNISMPRAVAYP